MEDKSKLENKKVDPQTKVEVKDDKPGKVFDNIHAEPVVHEPGGGFGGSKAE